MPQIHHDYALIRAWQVITGSMPAYTDNLVEEAKTMNAPANSVYYDSSNDRWVVIDEVSNIEMKTQVLDWAKRFRDRHGNGAKNAL